MKTFPKFTTVDTNKLQPVELIHMDSVFDNVTYIRGFTFILTEVCENTRILWIFPTVYKWSPVCIICFIPTIPKNEKHPCRHVTVYEDGALENPTDVTNLLVDDFSI